MSETKEIEPMSLKEFEDLWKKSKKLKIKGIKTLITEKAVYQKYYDIVNAPWYAKLWWKLCTPFWNLQDWMDR